MKNVIAYVVLHYLDEVMTEKCLNALLALDVPEEAETYVVIVDNGSQNGSYDALYQRFAESDCVILLHSDENTGFARGNNIGCTYAKNVLGAGFVIALNNDLIITQKDFTARLLEEYKNSKFAVLGPDIVSLRTGEHQNPAHSAPPSKEEITARIAKYEFISRHYILHRIKRLFRKGENNSSGFNAKPASDTPAVNVVLHGACLIFSPVFIAKRKQFFNPATFLYFEEDILTLECMREGLTLRYEPSLKAIHYEDVATEAALANAGLPKLRLPKRWENDLTKIRHLLDSYQIYLQLLENE